jgi:hypothetical protein
MQQHDGFHFGKPGDVLRLVKSLYGLKQAGQLWFLELRHVLKKEGFTRLKSDALLSSYGGKMISGLSCPVFTDNITIALPSTASADQVVAKLSEHFKLLDLGPTSWLPDIEIARDCPNRRLTLSQRQYIIDMLDTYGFADCSPVQTLMIPNTHLSASDCPTTSEERGYMQQFPYINAVGALMYLATSTHPDIAYTWSKLACFNSNPGKVQSTAVKHLFRYLKELWILSSLMLLTHPNQSYSASTLMQTLEWVQIPVALLVDICMVNRRKNDHIKQ